VLIPIPPNLKPSQPILVYNRIRRQCLCPSMRRRTCFHLGTPRITTDKQRALRAQRGGAGLKFCRRHTARAEERRVRNALRAPSVEGIRRPAVHPRGDHGAGALNCCDPRRTPHHHARCGPPARVEQSALAALALKSCEAPSDRRAGGPLRSRPRRWSHADCKAAMRARDSPPEQIGVLQDERRTVRVRRRCGRARLHGRRAAGAQGGWRCGL
jgi:hypothetical protein